MFLIPTIMLLSSLPSIKAEVNGVSVPAVVYHDTTYVLSNSLDLFHTPYHNEGNGVFDIAGKEVTAIEYHNQYYLPWNTVAPPKVVPHKIQGGWNFTRGFTDNSSDQYHLVVLYPTTYTSPGNFIPFYIQCFDSNGDILPNQDFTMDMYISSPGYENNPSIPDKVIDSTGPSGTYYWPQGLLSPGQLYTVVDWKDPKGVVHSFEQKFKVGNPMAQQTLPSGESLVAKIPIIVSPSYQVLFNASSGSTQFEMQLDTGADTPVIPESLANQLNLPKREAIQVVGVDEKPMTAYLTTMTLTIGGVTFNNVQAIIDPAYTGYPLLGYSFFVQNNLDLYLSLSNLTMYFMKPSQ